MKTRWLGLMLAVLLTPASARGGYWPEDGAHIVACPQSSRGCTMLQMVMGGSFADFDAEDSLCQRVFSAALPHLQLVTEADFAHFLDEFDVEEALLRRCYYAALGNALWADVLVAPGETLRQDQARQVLLLFLDPGSEPDGLAQQAAIRSQLNEEHVAMLARKTEVPVAFIEHLVYSTDWKNPALEAE